MHWNHHLKYFNLVLIVLFPDLYVWQLRVANSYGIFMTSFAYCSTTVSILIDARFFRMNIFQIVEVDLQKNNVSKNRQKWKRSLILFRMHWSLIRNRMSLCILNRKRKAFLSQTKTLFLHLVSMCRLTCIWGIYNIMNIRITIKWMLSNILSQ